jgi:hypothetical protein
MRRISPLLLALSACVSAPLAPPDVPTPDPSDPLGDAVAMFPHDDALLADGLRVDAEGAWLDATLHVRPFGTEGPDAARATDPVAGRCTSGETCALARVDEATTAWWEALPHGARLGWTVRAWEGDTLEVGATLTGAELQPHAEGAVATRDDHGRWRIGAPRAWDADGRELPARMTVEGQTLRVRVAVAGARAPVTVDPDFSEYAFGFYGGNADWALSRVDGGRDLNDDGEPDIVLGAPGYGNVDVEYGPLVSFDRPSSGGFYAYPDGASLSQLGAAVRMVDDVTGDGKPDVVAGDPVYKPVGGVLVGRVAVFAVPVTGWWGQNPMLTPTSGIALAGLGASVTGGTFDGSPHVIVGAPTTNPTGGGVAVGNCLSTTCVWSTYANDSEGSFGTSVALGDFDGDGNPEVWIGAPDALSGKGAVFGYEGLTDVSAPTWRIFGLSDDRLGAEIVLHDLDGDGKEELFIGAPGANSANGMVRAFKGRAQPSGSGPHVIDYGQAVVIDGRDRAALGWALAVGGDADGDRVPDLLIGAPRANDGRGAVVFARGRDLLGAFTSGETPAVTIEAGTVDNAYFGTNVAFVGDQTGDDIDDVAVGSPGDVNGSLANAGSVLVYRGVRDADGDGYPEGTDCDDGDAGVNPGATEVCDLGNVDEDCDGNADGADAEGTVPWFRDGDGDGYGGEPPTMACDAPGQDWRAIGGDCDDSRSDIHPDAEEACNGRDDDCDGANDEGLDAVTHYADVDGDGFGDETTLDATCDGDVPEGRVAMAGDCDDRRGGVNPDATEVCGDDLDSDCDGDPDAGCENFDAWDTYLGCASGTGRASSGALGVFLLAVAVGARRRTRR